MALWNGGDDRSAKEKLMDEYSDDRPMIFGGEDYEELSNFISTLEVDRDISSMKLGEVIELKNERSFVKPWSNTVNQEIKEAKENAVREAIFKETSNSVIPVSEDDMSKSAADDKLYVMVDTEPKDLFIAFCMNPSRGGLIAIPMNKYEWVDAVSIIRMLKKDGYVIYVTDPKSTDKTIRVGGYKNIS